MFLHCRGVLNSGVCPSLGVSYSSYCRNIWAFFIQTCLRLTRFVALLPTIT
jgi:hypothetical protein